VVKLILTVLAVIVFAGLAAFGTHLFVAGAQDGSRAFTGADCDGYRTAFRLRGPRPRDEHSSRRRLPVEPCRSKGDHGERM